VSKKIEKEAIHHPGHYGGGDNPYEAVKVIEAWGAGFNTGNALKYICRAESKGAEQQDYKKACWYLLRELATKERKDPDFYNDMIKAMAHPGAVRVKTASRGEIEVMREGKPPKTEKMAKPCTSCASPSMPYGTCHSCGRKWGSCADAACEKGHHQWGLAPTTETKCAHCKRTPGSAGVVYACAVCGEPLEEGYYGSLSFVGDRYHGAAHFKCQTPEERMRKIEDPDRVELRLQGKQPCDEPNCAREATDNWHDLDLCKNHMDMAASEWARPRLEKIREAKRLFQEARGKAQEARGQFANARAKIVEAKQHFAEAGEAYDAKIEVLEREVWNLKSRLEQEAMEQAAEVDGLREQLKAAHERVPREVDLALFRSSQVVEKAYGRCRAADEIRGMGSDVVKIRPLARNEDYCLGCNGGSVHHTCGKVPDASRCDRCYARLSTNVHDCLKMGTPEDHYVSFLEGELRSLRGALVDEFGVTPANGAVREALRLIRSLKGQGAADRLINGPRVKGDQTPHQLRVEKMMQGFGQEVPEKPLETSAVPYELRVLRARLIMEECLETVVDGLGIELTDRCGGVIDFAGLGFDALPGKFNMIEFADGCADISVVTIGSLSAFGIKDAPLLREVDANNQAKIDTGRKDEHGKWIKHPDHKGPDIARVLNKQGWGYQGKAGVMGPQGEKNEHR
jgi:predicted HAD superfamily Cof-like phosphohydrolase